MERAMNEAWVTFAVYGDAASAEATAGLLRSEAVPVRVASGEPVPGLIEGIRVMVPPDMLDRAKRILSQAQLSDEELAFLATGVLGEDDGKEPSGK
jgi:hypothetical protein